jgi:hypothetical protein
MGASFKFLSTLMLLISLGCSPSQNQAYVPSITSLSSNETLIMKLRACHWGCTKGTIKFRNGNAIYGRYALELTSKEISDLNSYFLLGRDLDSSWRCSLPIYISFRQANGIFTVNSKERQIYPCRFGDANSVNPEQLVRHFTETPTEIPYWRLSPEEQSKQHVQIAPAEN